jgi:anti-sigma B factor antagonist
MDIKTNISGNRAVLTVSGKLTVQTSPDLHAAIEQLPTEVCDIDIDVADVSYMASAGLRVLVSSDKLAAVRGGVMRLLHPCEAVMEQLEMTGLAGVLAIEQ